MSLNDFGPPSGLEIPKPGAWKPRRRLVSTDIPPQEVRQDDDEEQTTVAQRRFKKRKARLRGFPGFFETACRNALEHMSSIRDRRLARRIAQQVGTDPIVVVCISDTHNLQVPDVPNGDILIHAGDLTEHGTMEELKAALSWLEGLPHPHKFFIAGNHDTCLPEISYSSIEDEFPTLTYLQDSSATCVVRGRKVGQIGCPWTPKFGNWAFQYPRGSRLCESPLGRIQEVADSASFQESNVDKFILVTHGPPEGHLDDTPHGLSSAGCGKLMELLWSIHRKPDLHVFGHIHDSRGTEMVKWDLFQWLSDQLPLFSGQSNTREESLEARWISLLVKITLSFTWWLVSDSLPFLLGEKLTIMVNASSLHEVRRGTGRIEKRARPPLVVHI